MIAALVLTFALAGEIDPAACRTATPQCRQSVGEAILTERTIAEAQSNNLDLCMGKLAARTSTVIRELVPVPPSQPEAVERGPTLELVIVVAAIAAVIAGGVGYALGVSGKDDPQTIVVR